MNLHDDIGAYAAGVRDLARYEDEARAENVLHWRDRIYFLIEAGAPVDPPDRDVLDRADRALVDQRADLVRRFPGVFRGNNLLQARWWWHLDLGGPAGCEW